ncbi:MAG: glycosyltransferase [Holophaga sp.]|nr:glycosyltransferase [Holophaga sp.]
MDLVFLTTSLDRGGAETQVVRIATTLRRRGWQVGILTMLPSSAFLEDIQAAGIPLAECLGAQDRIPWRSAWRIIRQLHRWRPGILATFNFPADAFGRVCGRIARVPTIVSAVGTTRIKTRLREQFYRRTEPLIAMTVANSKAAASALTAQGILSARKTCVIPNGLILDQFPHPAGRAEVRAALGVEDHEFLWIAVGNLRPAKDYPTLLEAAARCAKARPGFRLTIVGGGAGADLKPAADAPYAEGLRQRAAALGLDPAVAFLGSRADVPWLLRAADAFVLSSAWEGMPNTVMEAMASGLPVVATDVGDVRELVEEGRSGSMVPAQQPEALAERMLAMMDLGRDALAAQGAWARQRIRDRYENERVVDQWEALFRQLAPPGDRFRLQGQPTGM